MKKTAVLLMCLILLTACSDNDIGFSSETISSVSDSATPSATSDTEDSTAPEATSGTEDSDAPSVPDVSASALKAGIWEAEQDGVPFGYYCIYADGTGGATLSYENGIGVSLSYKISDGVLSAAMGAVDCIIQYNILEMSDDYAELESVGGDILKLRYYSDDDPLTFEFNTNVMLTQYAMDYYERENGARPPCGGAETNADGTVTIHLYESLSDHNSTWAWYTVERETGRGKEDILGKEICIIP